MENSTIVDITKLQFYTDTGIIIPTEISYVLKWRLIPGTIGKQYINEAPSGFFIGDLDENCQLSSLYTGLINKGKIVLNFSTVSGTDENGFQIYSYDQTPSDQEYFEYLRDVILLDDNAIEFVVTINNKEYTNTFSINNIFKFPDNPEDYSKYFGVQTVYIGDNTSDSHEYFQTLMLENIDLNEYEDTSFILYYIKRNLPNINQQFPFIRYKGSFTQESVSVNFIAANTIVVLEKNTDGDDISYKKPYINANTKYSLVFQPTSNSQLHLINPDEDYEVKYVDEIAFSLADEDTTPSVITPLSFAIGFITDEEGAYQNYLGIYIRAIDNPDKVYFMGAISIRSKAIGEDDRFRTLLTNFGVPDPKYYSTLFAGQEFGEELPDYKIVNEKSKQLMLTYDQIFDYVGTYKALINAVKFLGYYDLIFKEWYTIKTANDTETDIAVQVFDTSTGEYLKQKLAYYGISIEDFKNYSKINKLTMIYHINEIDEENTETIQTKLAQYNPECGRIDLLNQKGYHYSHIDVPLTKTNYTYRTTEVLAKLYAIKLWLEQHIIGVGAYIADISGEFVTFGWQKTQGYQTQHHLVDYSQEQYYTPDVKCVLPFKDSHGKIACTLNELNNAVKIEDYEETPFEAFLKFDSFITEIGDISVLHVSNTLEAPVLGDEFEFDVINNTDHGTLFEWSNSDSSSQIYVDDGEIKFLFDEYVDVSIDSSVCLPYITLENANIHKNFGEWRKNIKWLIREVIDDNGNTAYSLKNYKTSQIDNYKTYNNYYIVLQPSSEDAYIKYSAKNKWGLPLFLIHGYKFANIDIDNEQLENFNLSDNEFVLEILKGDIYFPDSFSRSEEGVSPVCAQLSFDNDPLLVKQQGNSYVNTFANEQQINLHYTYHSERKPFTYIDISTLKSDINNIDVSEQVNNDIATIKNDCSILDKQLLTDLKNRNNINYSLSVPSENVALNEASSYLNSSEYVADVNNFLSEKEERLTKKYEFDEYLKAYENNYTFNQCIDVDVTRLGEYEVISRAYDKYNNGFVAKYDKTAIISAKPIEIDTYSSKQYSNNDEFFYRYNANGIPVDSSSLLNLVNNCDKHQKFPRNFTIQDFDFNSLENSITFDNYSYVIDTPKNNDYVIFENANEKADHADKLDSSTIRLYMLDENPDHIKIYNKYANNCNIVVEDPLLKQYIKIISGEIHNSYKANPDDDTDFGANSYIEVEVSENVDEIVELINNKKYSVTVLNTTVYPLEKQEELVGALNCNIYNDYDTQQTHIILSESESVLNPEVEPLFEYEDVVKIRYYLDCSINGNSFGNIVNETAYRIIDINPVDAYNNVINFDLVIDTRYKSEKTIYGYEYVLDGLINNQFIQNTNSDKVLCCLTRANHYPVRYVSRVEGNGSEYNYNVGIDNYTILQDYFKFNTSQMFLNYYIDDTYGGIIQDYDNDNLTKIWCNYSKIVNEDNVNDMQMYYFHEFPVTIEQGRHILFTDHDTENVFTPGYHTSWKVSSDTIDDTNNWDAHLNTNDKEVLFRSINKILSIKPEILGAHDIELTCIDKYGNKLVNPGSGKLYVKENESYISDLGF